MPLKTNVLTSPPSRTITSGYRTLSGEKAQLREEIPGLVGRKKFVFDCARHSLLPSPDTIRTLVRLLLRGEFASQYSRIIEIAKVAAA